MSKVTQLASGKITNYDEITATPIEPTDGTHRWCGCNTRYAHNSRATHYPAVAAAIVRIIAESATTLASIKLGRKR